MKGYGRRAERWAIAVLEAVWAGKEPPRRWRLGAGDLQRMVHANDRVRTEFERLSMLADIVAEEVDEQLRTRGLEDAVVAAALHTAGVYTLEVADAPNRFEARVAALWAGETDPLRGGAGAFAGIGVVFAAVIGILVASSLRTAEPEFVARGQADDSALRVGAYCLVDTDGTLDTWAMSETRGCPISGHLATSVTDARGRELGVVVFGVQSGEAGVKLLPYAPTPSSAGPHKLVLGATEQRLGAARRLAVNHAVGDLGVVVLAFDSDITWDEAAAALEDIAETAGADVSLDGVAAAVQRRLVERGAQPAGRSVLRSRLSLE